MKRETTFIIVMLLFGIIAGVAVSAVLMAVSVPSTSPYLTTLAEKADFERVNEYSRLLTGRGSWLIYGVFLASLVFVFSLFLTTINPQVKNAVKNWRTTAGLKFGVVLLAAFGWVYVLLIGSDSLFVMEPGILKAVQFIIYAVCTAGIWFVAGEQGWAGDFSSWKQAKEARPRRTALLGAAAGIAIFVVYQMSDWSFKKYFILVSEALDLSGETSFLGFVQLASGLVICFATAFPLIAGFITAFAPVQRENSEVKRRLVYPGIALAAIALSLAAAYGYAGSRYDLNKKDLASVLGISDTAKESRSIVVFLSSKGLPVTVQEWPLQASGSGFTSRNTIELTRENLQKVEAYLAAHPDGTIFTYPAREILVNGYYALWDGENGLAWQLKAAESQLLPRQLLLARLRSMTVTPRNLKVLESYSDEKNWHVGGRSALSFSMAYQHFGKTAEAQAWFQKAKDRGGDVSKTDFLADPVVTNGVIRGRVLLNGKPFSGGQIALLSLHADKQQSESFKLTEPGFGRLLVDAKQTDKNGTFAFSSLGSGKYVIALMTNKEVVPFGLKPGAITANNMPGLVTIGPAVTRDLGTISIVRTQ